MSDDFCPDCGEPYGDVGDGGCICSFGPRFQHQAPRYKSPHGDLTAEARARKNGTRPAFANSMRAMVERKLEKQRAAKK